MQLLTVLMLLSYLSFPSTSHGSTVRTVDESGAPFPNVLVIIQSFDGKGEIGRYLSDQKGRTPPFQLGLGLYRMILTCPYGVCRTSVREFLGAKAPSEIVEKLELKPTDLNGEILRAPKIRVKVLSWEGKPQPGAHILVRDPKAKWEKWYVTDSVGSAMIELLSEPTVVVVVGTQSVTTREFGLTCASDLSTASTPNCQTVSPEEVVRIFATRPGPRP